MALETSKVHGLAAEIMGATRKTAIRQQKQVSCRLKIPRFSLHV